MSAAVEMASPGGGAAEASPPAGGGTTSDGAAAAAGVGMGLGATEPVALKRRFANAMEIGDDEADDGSGGGVGGVSGFSMTAASAASVAVFGGVPKRRLTTGPWGPSFGASGGAARATANVFGGETGPIGGLAAFPGPLGARSPADVFTVGTAHAGAGGGAASSPESDVENVKRRANSFGPAPGSANAMPKKARAGGPGTGGFKHSPAPVALAADADDRTPRYSARDLRYMEQRKAAELNRLRSKCDIKLMTKDREVAVANQRADAAERATEEARAATSEAEARAARLLEENALLKRAVAIQNRKAQEAQARRAPSEAAVAQLQEALRRSEAMNFALRVQLSNASGDFDTAAGSGMAPPDVY